jgi:hypothetical protein
MTSDDRSDANYSVSYVRWRVWGGFGGTGILPVYQEMTGKMPVPPTRRSRTVPHFIHASNSSLRLRFDPLSLL